MIGPTNATPKGGMLTINSVEPDGNGDFTIQAGTSDTITVTTTTNGVVIETVFRLTDIGIGN